MVYTYEADVTSLYMDTKCQSPQTFVSLWWQHQTQSYQMLVAFEVHRNREPTLSGLTL